MNSLSSLISCHESGCHSLQLHITHGLHLPSCTALTHFHPPLHQSHSCHHSLISLDCLTTPAPRSHTHLHIKQHSHMHSPQSLVLPRLTFWAFPLYSVSLDCLHDSDHLLPAFLTLPALWYPLCLPPAPTFALSLLLILPSLHYSCYCLTIAVWPPLVCIKAAIGSNLTASSLHKPFLCVFLLYV